MRVYTLLGIGLLAALACLPLTAMPPAASGEEAKKEDRGKKRVEIPLERSLAKLTLPELPAAEPGIDNQKVAPGKVNWHATWEEACAAARKSGKPVLLFQLMGNLDDRFC